jgi:TRAP-type C4-dicarboxylate transport system permease small subunit
MMFNLGKITKGITDGLAVVAGFMLVAIVIIICIDVGMRYFFKNSQVWTVETCEYLVFGITFCGAPWLLRTNGHVSVDLITGHLSPKIQRYLNIFSALVGFFVTIVLAYFGATTAIEAFESGVLEVRTLDVPKYYFMVVMSVGYLLLSIEFIRKLACQLRQKEVS